MGANTFLPTPLSIHVQMNEANSAFWLWWNMLKERAGRGKSDTSMPGLGVMVLKNSSLWLQGKDWVIGWETEKELRMKLNSNLVCWSYSASNVRKTKEPPHPCQLSWVWKGRTESRGDLSASEWSFKGWRVPSPKLHTWFPIRKRYILLSLVLPSALCLLPTLDLASTQAQHSRGWA